MANLMMAGRGMSVTGAHDVQGRQAATHAAGLAATSETAAITSGSSKACQIEWVSSPSGAHHAARHHQHAPPAAPGCQGWWPSCPGWAAGRPPSRLASPPRCLAAAVVACNKQRDSENASTYTLKNATRVPSVRRVCAWQQQRQEAGTPGAQRPPLSSASEAPRQRSMSAISTKKLCVRVSAPVAVVSAASPVCCQRSPASRLLPARRHSSQPVVMQQAAKQQVVRRSCPARARAAALAVCRAPGRRQRPRRSTACGMQLLPVTPARWHPRRSVMSSRIWRSGEQ